jgi:hypothetical protein
MPTSQPTPKPTVYPTKNPTLQMVYGVEETDQGEALQHFSIADDPYREDQGIVSELGEGLGMSDINAAVSVGFEEEGRRDDDGFSVRPKPQDMNMGVIAAENDDDGSEKKHREQHSIPTQPMPITGGAEAASDDVHQPKEFLQKPNLVLLATGAGLVIAALIFVSRGRIKASAAPELDSQGAVLQTAIVLTPSDGTTEFL